MKICSRCGFENNDNAKKCSNCLVDLHWAKVNLGKFQGNAQDARKIGIESRKQHGLPVPDDKTTPLAPIQIVNSMSDTEWGYWPLWIIAFVTTGSAAIIKLVPYDWELYVVLAGLVGVITGIVVGFMPWFTYKWRISEIGWCMHSDLLDCNDNCNRLY